MKYSKPSGKFSRVQGTPPVIYTDSEGIFSFPLKDADNQVRVRVEAEGYEKFDRFITLSTRAVIEEIQLSLSQTKPESDSGKPKVKIRPYMTFNKEGVYLDNNGALDYIEGIKIDTKDISGSDVIQSIVIYPKIYLEKIPFLEVGGTSYEIKSEKRGKKFEIIYDLQQGGGSLIANPNPKFRLEIIP